MMKFKPHSDVIVTNKGHQFVLTGSSARKLDEGVNLLAGVLCNPLIH